MSSEITPEGKGLNYHFTKETDWRTEAPPLDRSIESIIEKLLTAQISLPAFCNKMNGYMKVATTLTEEGELSGYALFNYAKVYALVIEQYDNDEERMEPIGPRRAKDIDLSSFGG